jgi:hypothetical protein
MLKAWPGFSGSRCNDLTNHASRVARRFFNAMVTDDLVQKDSRVCLFSANLVRADGLGLPCIELDGGGGECLAVTIAGRISCRISGCHDRAIGFGIIRAARGR